jgi:hypothetical protein
MINISKLDYLLRPAPFYPLLRPLLEQSALRQWHKTQKPRRRSGEGANHPRICQ